MTFAWRLYPFQVAPRALEITDNINSMDDSGTGLPRRAAASLCDLQSRVCNRDEPQDRFQGPKLTKALSQTKPVMEVMGIGKGIIPISWPRNDGVSGW